MSDYHRMDTDGYSGHADLHRHAKKRFLKAARRFADQLEQGESHKGPMLVAFLRAYKELKAAE